ncbi:TRAP transporter substrate-binding protein [Vreelandella alkaliphila]|uniref:C4-dicarboxylate ABC transporter substrate-binding protein n=1 Tax=Vreelandella alkaliphila TaxID=272774 RepID=A0AAJ2RTY2_9GAMM|nr:MULTISPECIES: TRAP transporter substrate-binding protein [Halomonas]AIA74856.1 C4-dicarboxylate ABC transporter substrate-binding protein [Halomonas campaniensis]MCD6005974.1 TRAP transporter substrate-binding protein [Halomonas sp. IOP_6]MCD6438773.1 TRAP transporter substrate-binding protein [Halomonas sp.]MDX5978393.1 TRAP transporter substrate-binding protein [Halomonas alkaliphila]PAU70374.1 C4-dicarboxylate ABC transporter substrate-binding protein [Halomonas humidisoli]
MNNVNKLVSATFAIGLTMVSWSAQARDFRLGMITPPSHLWTQAAEAFGDDLAAASGGEHSVSVFPSQQLGNEAQMVQQLQAGSLDMAFLTIAEMSNRAPDFGALYAPYLVEDVAHAARLLRSDTATDLLELLPAQTGLVGIGYGMSGMRQILSRNSIDSPENLEGLRLRITPFEPIRDFYLAAGTAPTPLPLPDVYDALANGQVDAIDMDFEAIEALKFYDQAEHLLISNHMMFPMVGVVSGRVWRELEETDRELIRTTMQEHLSGVIDSVLEREPAQEASLREQDIRVVEVDQSFFQEAVERWEGIWADKAPVLLELRETAAQLKAE